MQYMNSQKLEEMIVSRRAVKAYKFKHNFSTATPWHDLIIKKLEDEKSKQDSLQRNQS